MKIEMIKNKDFDNFEEVVNETIMKYNHLPDKLIEIQYQPVITENATLIYTAMIIIKGM